MVQTLDIVELAARITHEVNRAYCISIGDKSQPVWELAPEWQKESARAGVKHVLENPTTTPEQTHQSWLTQKLADGWAWGPVKDPANKLHPCMVNFEELPVSQRAKDNLFIAAVGSLLAAFYPERTLH